MRQLLIFILGFLITLDLTAQKQKYFSIAAFTTQNAMPFGKLGGLFKEVIHPGVEFGIGKELKPKKNHLWFMEFKFAYFFHRYVQHGLPLYVSFGYRHNLKKRFSVETAIGAGYMQSIPATAKLELSSDGDYENNKGFGRMQATANYSLGLGYIINPKNIRPTRVFANWQQRLQMPFVKSYVPLLPYNSFLIGISRPLKKN